MIILSVSFLLTVLGCGVTDGPNQTGAAYLKEQNLLLATDLKKVTIQYPVDSFWVESPRISNLGASFLTISDEHGFRVNSRVGVFVPYDSLINDTNIWVDYSALELNLLLSDFWGLGNNKVPDSVLADIQTLGTQKIVITSILLDSIDAPGYFALDEEKRKADLPDILLEAKNKKETLATKIFLNREEMTRTLFNRRDSASFVADTLLLPVPTDSLVLSNYKVKLPNTLSALNARKKSGMGTWIFSDLRLFSKNTKPITFRYFASRGGLMNLTRPTTVSEEGDTLSRASTINLNMFKISYKQNSIEMIDAIDFSATNTNIRKEGRPAVISGKFQGVHFILDRKKVVQALDKALPELGLGKFGNNYLTNYWIPFAEFTIPVVKDSVFIENGDFLKMNLYSILDSLPPVKADDEPLEGFEYPQRELSLNSEEAAHYKVMNTITGEVVDTLKISYTESKGRRQLMLFEFSNNPLQNDTLDMTPSAKAEYPLIYYGFFGSVKLKFVIEKSDSAVFYTIKKENGGVEEPNDPEGWQNSQDRVPRFLSQGLSEIKMRSTLGMQRLINLGREDHQVQHDFYLTPDNGFASLADSVGILSFQPLADVPLQLDSKGKLIIGIEVVFYEL